jgi:two-component system sensor histidine kinase KdpD
VADDVDQRMHQSVTEKKGEILVSERILVCVNHRPHSEKLLRRGWRIADRLKAELWVLVVVCQDTFHPTDQKDLDKVKKLSEQFGAHFLTVQANKQQIGEKIVETAKDLGVSQLVAGQPSSAHQRFGWKRHNPLFYVLDHAEFVDLHIVAYEEVRKDNKSV